MALKTPCTHGSNKENLDFFRPMHYYVKMCEVQNPANEYDAFVDYWIHNPNVITEQGSNILKSMATTCVLENEYDSLHDARMYLGIATKFDAVLALGGLKEFQEAVQHNPENWCEEGTDPRLCPYYKAVQQICSNQGLVKYLVDRQACRCLDEIHGRYDTLCDACLESNDKILRCAQCHCAKYCTPDCQKRDWTSHKRYCQKLQHVKKQLAHMVEKEEEEG